jgi:chaperonin cofactor prefoldin
MAQKDPELMAAFDELRKITNETRSKQMQLKADIEGNQRLAKRDELINKELEILPNDKNYYLSVGRMFMRKGDNLGKLKVKNTI